MERVASALGVALCVGVSACGPAYDSVDDACAEGGIQASGVPGDLVGPLTRVDCYRRFLGLSGLNVDDGAMDAARAHAAYLVAHDPRGERERAALNDWRREDAAEEDDFTGVTVEDRLVEAGVVLQDARGWDAYVDGLDGDAWMRDPVARALFLQPGLRGAGAAVADLAGIDVVVLHGFASVPSNRAVERPVVWPPNGFDGAGLAVEEPPWMDWGLAARGLPITLHFGGASYPASSGFNVSNPYGLAVDEDDPLVLRRDDGVEVVSETLGVQTGSLGLLTTVAVWPVEPLDARTTYTLSGQVNAAGDLFANVNVSFTTAD